MIQRHPVGCDLQIPNHMVGGRIGGSGHVAEA
jgi:hypothetical protein